MPEPVAARARLRLTPQRPSVPTAVRRPFLLASLGVHLVVVDRRPVPLARPAALGATCSTRPTTSSPGVGVFALAGSAAVAQLVFGRTRALGGRRGRSVALAAGMVLIVLAASTGSSALYLAGSVIGGAGFGVAFLGGLRALVGRDPARAPCGGHVGLLHRRLPSLSVPAILAGVLVTPLGLQTTFEIFGSVIAALALVVAFEAWRTRPRVEVVRGDLGYDAAG